MDKAISASIERILEKGSVDAIYLYGSYVNGYYRYDSDIDLVVLSSTDPKDKPTNLPPNINIHYINSPDLKSFEKSYQYTHLKMVPVYNDKICNDISDKMKSELVRRELIRFRKKRIEEFDILDPLNNFFLGHGVQRPWRIGTIKRIFASDEAKKILREEYKYILDILEQKGMVKQGGKKYVINCNYVFDTKFRQPKDYLLYKIKSSYGGWHYLKNSFSIIDFAIRRI